MFLLDLSFLVFLSFFFQSSAAKEKDSGLLKAPQLPLLNGTRYRILRPHLQFADDAYVVDTRLFHPDHWVKSLEQTFTDLDEITIPPQEVKTKTIRRRAIEAYAHFLINSLTGLGFGDAEKSLYWDGKLIPYNQTRREIGMDWTYLGVTMVGKYRLINLLNLITDIVANHIPGHFIETGVWRGGSSTFAASLFHLMHQPQRLTILCDSFHGLPPGDSKIHESDLGWDRMKYLSVSERKVARNMNTFGVLNENVYFVKGYFNDSMPHLAPHVDNIAILRLDGDMYQSTVDVLYFLFDKVSIGGYVIVDDWTGFPAKDAVLDFLACHKLSPKIIAIDETATYFQKTEQVEVQRWRYEKRRFKPTEHNN